MENKRASISKGVLQGPKHFGIKSTPVNTKGAEVGQSTLRVPLVMLEIARWHYYTAGTCTVFCWVGELFGRKYWPWEGFCLLLFLTGAGSHGRAAIGWRRWECLVLVQTLPGWPMVTQGIFQPPHAGPKFVKLWIGKRINLNPGRNIFYYEKMKLKTLDTTRNVVKNKKQNPTKQENPRGWRDVVTFRIQEPKVILRIRDIVKAVYEQEWEWNRNVKMLQSFVVVYV